MKDEIITFKTTKKKELAERAQRYHMTASPYIRYVLFDKNEPAVPSAYKPHQVAGMICKIYVSMLERGDNAVLSVG